MQNYNTAHYIIIKLVILCFIFVAVCIGACEPELMNVGETQHSSPDDIISIDNAGIIPVLSPNSPTSSIIYVRNHSDKSISRITYTVKNNDLTPNSFSIPSTQCATIAAHSRCALNFSISSLEDSVAQSSALITVTLANNYSFSQVINYARVFNNDTKGVFVNSGVILANFINNTAYATLYVYGGAGGTYTLTNFISDNSHITVDNSNFGKVISGNEIVAIEVSTNQNNISSNLSADAVSMSNAKYSTTVSISTVPSSDGALLTSGLSPIIDTNSTLIGSFTIVNSGNATATFGTVTYPSGVSYNSSTTCGTTLASHVSCTFYFNVTSIGSSGSISIPYTGGNGYSPLTQDVIWYNSKSGGALVQMSASTAPISMYASNESVSATITVTNLSAYSLTGVTVPTATIVSGSATVTVSSDTCTGTTIANGSSCTYNINVSDSVSESSKQINVGISASYNNDSSSTYARVLPVSYTVYTIATWMSGSSSVNQTGTYGTNGTASSTNVPGARRNGISWIDSSGNLWLFGGEGYATTTSPDYLNDLWKYNPTTGYWTWMSGSSSTNQVGTYGTKGTASSTNVPGARRNSISWIDSSGNLWLFGGTGYSATAVSYLNDLWKYNPTTGYWTWMSGANTTNTRGTYGTKGTASSTNVPGARRNGISWIDSSGNLWLFGGYGYSSATTGTDYLNDLWKYNPTTGYWTWMSGSRTHNQVGTYGTKGTASSTNVPGARQQDISWIDSSGNLWLFGGDGYDTTTSGNLNDLWKYSPTTGYWTWMSGSSSVDQVGTYGTQGTAASTNVPGSRDESISWIDSSGNLWLFGGFGYDTTSSSYLNDLWMYSPTTGNWTWMGGSDVGAQTGVYGTKGTGSTANIPGARYSSISWIDSSGNLWLFGGYGYNTTTFGYLNDLWKFTVQ